MNSFLTFTSFLILINTGSNLANRTEANIDQAIPRINPYCITPNGDAAYCVPIRNCSKFMNKLTDVDARKFLRSSRCGNKDEKTTNPFVCCGKYGNYHNLSVSDEVLPKKCGLQNVTVRGRILGGREAQIGEFPWMARLFHKDKFGLRRFGCAGFLISARFVLTAAHCIQSSNIDTIGPVFEVHLGEHDTTTDIDCNTKKTICSNKLHKSRIKKTFTHPFYNIPAKQYHNDIGLIALKKPAKFTEFIRPICLMEKSNHAPFEYWISGWGTTSSNSDLSNIKMKVSIPPFNSSQCKELYNVKGIRINNEQICAGGKKNKDSCVGDSGGPLMVVENAKRWIAAGIVSYGIECGKAGWPAVYTNITSYMDYITDTMLTFYLSTNKTIQH